MATPIIPYDQWRAIITQLIASGQWLDGVVFRLFVNDFNPTQATVLSQLVEAGFDGYAPVGPVAWAQAWTDGGGNGATSGSTVGFYCNGSDTPQTVFGYYVTHGPTASEVLRWVERFDTPRGMNGQGNAIVLPPIWSLPEPTSIVPQP